MRKVTHFKIYSDLGPKENECFDTQYQEKFSIPNYLATAVSERWKARIDQEACVQGRNTELTWISHLNLMKLYSSYMMLPRQQIWMILSELRRHTNRTVTEEWNIIVSQK